jgi:hypothetical protein
MLIGGKKYKKKWEKKSTWTVQYWSLSNKINKLVKSDDVI